MRFLKLKNQCNHILILSIQQVTGLLLIWCQHVASRRLRVPYVYQFLFFLKCHQSSLSARGHFLLTIVMIVHFQMSKRSIFNECNRIRSRQHGHLLSVDDKGGLATFDIQIQTVMIVLSIETMAGWLPLKLNLSFFFLFKKGIKILGFSNLKNKIKNYTHDIHIRSKTPCVSLS